MRKSVKIIIWIAATAVIAAIVGIAVWLINGGYSAFMPPVTATLPQDESLYGDDEKSAIAASVEFWEAMEKADEAGMRAVAHEECVFVHIGMTCELDEEIGFYTSGTFRPTEIVFHGRSVKIYGDTAVVLTDCDYSLSLGGMPTTHHFAVTEVFVRTDTAWKLIQFTFTALSS